MQLLYKIIFTGLIGLIVPKIVFAHPHIFIDVQPTFVFDENGLAGIKVKWVFDETFSEQIITDCDKNMDNKFNSEETKTVEKDYFSYTKKFNCFSIIKINDIQIKNISVNDFQVTINPDDGTVTYNFFIPVDISSTTDTKITKIQYIFNDRTIYISFETECVDIPIEGKSIKILKQHHKGHSFYGYEFRLEVKKK